MSATGEVHVRGIGLACALGRGVEACTAALEAGRVRTERVVLDELAEPQAMSYYRIPDGAPLFDPGRFDRLLPEVAREAVDSAGLERGEIERLPVFVGSTSFSISKSEALYLDMLRAQPDAAFALPLLGFQHIASALRESIGAGGDDYTFNTACTAGANALMCAARMIRLGWYANALVVGVELANRTTLAGFSGLQLVAQTLRPFDRRRSGIVLGEGIGAVILSAQDVGTGIRWRSGASNGDSYGVTTANPDGSTIAAVQAAALAEARVAVAEVRGIKSHGTASPLNDTGEAAGIRRVFGEPPPVCALKPYVGHTLGACGVNELVLLAAALRRGFFPATPGFEEEDPELGLQPTRRHEPAASGAYLLNYFGFGGSNTSLVMEKA